MRASLVKVALAATALVTVAVIAGRQGFFAKNATQDQPAIVRSVPTAAPVDTGGPPLAGIDLTRIRVDDNGVSAPAAAGRTAMLTLDPELQKTASALLRSHK